MRKTIVLIAALAAYAAAGPVIESQVPEYQRYIQFSDGDGVTHTVDLEEEPDHQLLQEVQRNPANNLYQLFTRQNPDSAQTLVIDDVNSVQNSNFNPNDPTVVIVHGWLSHQETNLNPTIRDAYLNKGDYNVIVLDWSRLAIGGYVTAASGVPAVGRGLGQFLRFLHETTGAPYSSLHLIGFSLGAHLVGNAGRELGGVVGRITGLDPAGPLWYTSSNRISPNDGVYVEAIHTDGGTTIGGLGIGVSVGDADFFVNGGSSQPLCLTNICNHNRAWRYFAATVTYDHLTGRECSNIIQLNLNLCRGQSLNMGNADLTKSGSGKYRANTGRRYPY